MAKEKEVRFAIPKGFVPPSGSEIKDGKFDLVCTFEIESNGKELCLTKLGDFDMEYGEDEESEHKPSYKAEASAMTQAMGQQAGLGATGGMMQ